MSANELPLLRRARRSAPMPGRRAMIGVAGLAAISGVILSAEAARAEVRLAGEAGGNYRVSVMSWWDIPFRSIIRQQYDFSCGSAAVATLLTYHFDRPTPERESFAAMWKKGDQPSIRKVGFSMLDMKNFLTELGYPTEGFRLPVDHLAKLNRPSIVLIDFRGFKHFVVVKGVRGNRILLGDPMLGLTEYAISDFAKIWNGIALVSEAPQKRSPKFNLAGDWGPWSRAPLEQNALRVAAGDLTDHLPPSYQLTPQFLLDVRVGTVK